MRVVVDSNTYTITQWCQANAIRGWSLPSMSDVKAKSTHLKSLGFTTVGSPARGGTTVRCVECGPEPGCTS